jgi:hypothetical protein
MLFYTDVKLGYKEKQREQGSSYRGDKENIWTHKEIKRRKRKSHNEMMHNLVTNSLSAADQGDHAVLRPLDVWKRGF